MRDACRDCPCPETCLRWPSFCEMAASKDPIKLQHIRARSARAASPPVVDIGAVAAAPIPVDYDLPARPPGKCCG